MRIFVFLLLINAMHTHAQSSKDSLRKHVVKLSELAYPRNAENLTYLNKAADYIKAGFEKHSKKVFYQKYEIEKMIFKNVIASVGPDTGYRIIVGANYDVAGDTPGADANASGVSALIELCRLLSKIKNLPYRVDFVAYTLSENKNIPTERTGSYMHAKSLYDNKIKVLGMISLYGIGFFTDVPHTQKYPRFYQRIMHGHRANFITLYMKAQGGDFADRTRDLCRQYICNMKLVVFKPLIKIKKFAQGDYLSYQKLGYSFVKISNTNGYRNKYYQKDVDTYETLDFSRMAIVVNMLYETLTRFKI